MKIESTISSRLLLAAIWCLLFTTCLHPGAALAALQRPVHTEDEFPAEAKKPEQEVLHNHVGTKGAVSSESKDCSTWGKQIMQEGVSK